MASSSDKTEHKRMTRSATTALKTRQHSSRQKTIAVDDFSASSHVAEAASSFGPEDSIRMRQAASKQFGGVQIDLTASSRHKTRNSVPDEPPRFTIDLSSSPEQRYLEVCAAFKEDMRSLTSLFDEVVGGMVPFLPIRWLRILCRIALRGVYDREQNRELHGISKVTGVEMFLLVCFNVLLDLFMGCSSGGAAVGYESKNSSAGKKMLHFRTLDWGMPSLRKVVVRLDYVSEPNGPIIASTITYAGFVGVLTGVRKNLSISLNFRSHRIDNGIWLADAKYLWHHLMVLLGWRPSISCLLRYSLIPPDAKVNGSRWSSAGKGSLTVMPHYDELIKRFDGGKTGSPIITTACYLCFCNGQETTVIEKDRVSAIVRASKEFIVITNSDESDALTDHYDADQKYEAKTNDLAELVAEAKERQQCACINWGILTKRRSSSYTIDPRQKRRTTGRNDMAQSGSTEDVIDLVQLYPTTNECTHFATVLDPLEGRIVWCRRWKKPVTAKWIREHTCAGHQGDFMP